MKAINLKLITLSCLLFCLFCIPNTIDAQAPGKVQFSIHAGNGVSFNKGTPNYPYPYYYDLLVPYFSYIPTYDKVSNRSFALGTSVGLTLKNGLVARVRVDYDRSKIALGNHNIYEQDGNRSESRSDITRTQHSMQFAVGLQGYLGKGKLRLVAGLDAIARADGKITQDQINFSESDYPVWYSMSNSKETQKIDGGYALGAGLNIGLQFHLVKNIYLGAEFSPTLLFQKMGGTNNVVSEYSSVSKEKNSDGQIISEQSNQHRDTYTRAQEFSGWNINGKRMSLNLMFAF